MAKECAVGYLQIGPATILTKLLHCRHHFRLAPIGQCGISIEEGREVSKCIEGAKACFAVCAGLCCYLAGLQFGIAHAGLYLLGKCALLPHFDILQTTAEIPGFEQIAAAHTSKAYAEQQKHPSAPPAHYACEWGLVARHGLYFSWLVG